MRSSCGFNPVVSISSTMISLPINSFVIFLQNSGVIFHHLKVATLFAKSNEKAQFCIHQKTMVSIYE
jgi:hypothetical protein